MADVNIKTPQQLKSMLTETAQASKSLNEKVTTANGAVVGGPTIQTPPVTPTTTGG